MNCGHCKTTVEETQEQLEICPETADLRIKLEIEREHKHIVFWRKMTSKLKEITDKEEQAGPSRAHKAGVVRPQK